MRTLILSVTVFLMPFFAFAEVPEGFSVTTEGGPTHTYKGNCFIGLGGSNLIKPSEEGVKSGIYRKHGVSETTADIYMWTHDGCTYYYRIALKPTSKEEVSVENNTQTQNKENAEGVSEEVGEKKKKEEKVIQKIQDDSAELKEKVAKLQELISLLLQLIALRQGQM